MACATHALAQTANDGFAAAITSGAVHDAVVDGNGKIVVGGQFGFAGATRRVARLHPDGSRDTSFAFGLSSTAGHVASLLPASGGYLVGGSFTGGAAPDHLARLDANGALVPGFTVGVNGEVRTVVRRAAGNGYFIGGAFGTVNGAVRNRIARLTSAFTSDTAFNPPAFSGTVQAIVERGDGKVYVAGAFLGISGNAAAGYAVFRLNANGSLDPGFVFDAVPQALEHVNELALLDDGRLLIGGAFTATVGSEQRRRIARLDDDGRVDLTFEGPSLNGDLTDLAVQPDGRIVISGTFTGVGLGNDIARLHADGAVDATFAPLLDPDALVRSVTVQGDGGVLFAGDFTTITGAQTALRVARIPKTGGLERDFAPAGSANNDVRALTVLANGDVIAGGAFTSIGGDARTYLAKFLGTTGTLSSSFTPTLNGAVHALDIQPDGKILVGGAFTQVNGSPRQRLVRMLADGSIDSGFVPPAIPAGNVFAIEVDPQGRIYVGGDFQDVGGSGRRHLVRLLPTGAIDTAFEDPQVNDDVLAIAMAPDQWRVYIGGRFTEVDGFARRSLARVWPNGGLNTSFNGEIHSFACLLNDDPSFAVHALAVPPEGGVVVGGDFCSVRDSSGWVLAEHLHRFLEDGSKDLDFAQTFLGLNGSVRSLQLQHDGSIHGGGRFTAYGRSGTTTLRQGLARFHPTGALDASFDVAAITPVLQPAWVDTQALQGDGRLLVGGRFALLGGVARTNLGRIGNRDRIADEIVSMTPAGVVQWIRSGRAADLLAPPQLLMAASCCSASAFTPLPGSMSRTSLLGGAWQYDAFPVVFGTYYLRTRGRLGDSAGGGLYESPIVRFDGGPAPTAVADLAVVKSVAPMAAEPGEIVTFTVQVRNFGPDVATSTVVQDLLPEGYTYASHTVDQGGYVPATGVWSVGSMPASGSAGTRTLTIAATVNPGGNHVNLASASSAAFDPDLNNSIDFAEVSVLEPVDDTIFADGFESP